MTEQIKSKRDFDSSVYMRLGQDQLVTLALKFVLDGGKAKFVRGPNDLPALDPASGEPGAETARA